MAPNRGRATLRTSAQALELELEWDAARTAAAIGLGGVVVVDRRHTLAREGSVDPAGNALDGGALASGARPRFATRRGDVAASVVVGSSSAHLEEDVYPARVFDGTAPRVRVSIRFSEPMDPAFREVSWGADGGEGRRARAAQRGTRRAARVCGEGATGV